MSEEHPLPPRPDLGGPYVQIATFCEKVLQEQDGVISVIRAIDRVIRTEVGPEPPAIMPTMSLPMTVLIQLRAAGALGRHTVSIRTEEPSGHRREPVELPVHFEGQDRGNNLLIDLMVANLQEGLYWFDVLLDGERLLTRMPLHVIYQPMRTAAAK
jgi:hypothetical protein